MKLKHFALLGTMALGTMISSAASAGNNTLAFTGHDVWNYGNEYCMRMTWLNGGVKNQCSGTELWSIPLESIHVPYSNNYIIQVTGTRNATATQCIAIATDKYGNNVGQSGWVSLGTGSGWNTISLNVNVPAYANMQVQCNIPVQGIVQFLSF